jgi:possible abiZ
MKNWGLFLKRGRGMENIKVKIWDAEPSNLLLKIKEMLEKQKIDISRESEDEYDIVISSENVYKNDKAIFIQGAMNQKSPEIILSHLLVIADKLNVTIFIKSENLPHGNFGFKIRENYTDESYRKPKFIENKRTEIYRRLSIIVIFEVSIHPIYSTESISFESSLEELENILEINYNIWYDLYQDTDNINYSAVYQNLKNKISNFFAYFNSVNDIGDISDETLYSSIYNYISDSSQYLENKRKYIINIEAPINKDKNFIKIIEFYKYYQEQKFDNISLAIQHYIIIYRNPEKAGNFLNNTNLYYYYPAFHYLKEQFNIEFSNTKIDNEINILKTELSTIEEIIPKRKNEILNYMKSTSNEFDIWKNDFKENINDWRDEIDEWKEKMEKKLTILENTYREKLKLEEPEKLWNEKAKNYGKAYKLWGVFVILLSGAIVYFVNKIITEFYFNSRLNSVSDNDVLNYFPKTFLFVGILSLALYVLRVFIKITLSNKHLQLEYEQKAALTRFYQALVYEGQNINENERLIMFNTLFSKTESGLIKLSDTPNDIENMIFSILSKKS